MTTLHLHIGHSKTGTSYIQAALAQSVDILRDHGIDYPIDGPAKARAQGNAITSGNARDMLSGRDALDTWLDAHVPGRPAVLASSEYLFKNLYELMTGDIPGLDLATVTDTVARRGVTQVRILLFMREPHSLIASDWQQAIKRGGSTLGLADFADTKKPTYAQTAAEMLDALAAHALYDVTVRNYDHEKHAILDAFEDWLGLPRDTLTRPAVPVINRSLTATELELQRQINLRTPDAPAISDALAETLPNVAAEHRWLGPEAATALEHECQPFLDRVNRALPDGEKLVFRHGPPAGANGPFALDPAQIAVLADVILAFHAQTAQERQRADALAAEAHRQAARIDDLDAQLARLAHDKSVAEDIARTRIAGLEDMLTDLEARRRAAEDTARTRIDALDNALKKAWRDPIPHLIEAYARKIRAGRRKRGARG